MASSSTITALRGAMLRPSLSMTSHTQRLSRWICLREPVSRRFTTLGSITQTPIQSRHARASQNRSTITDRSLLRPSLITFQNKSNLRLAKSRCNRSMQTRSSSSSSSTPDPTRPTEPEHSQSPDSTSTNIQVVYATTSPSRRAYIDASLAMLLHSPPFPSLSPSNPSSNTNPSGRWHLSPSGHSLHREIRFPSFKQATQFMTALFTAIIQGKRGQKHHPTLTNTYNKVHIVWTTHRDPQEGLAGISERDVEMARVTDELVEEVGGKIG